MLVHLYEDCVTCNIMRCLTSDDIAGTTSRTAPGVQVLDKLKIRREIVYRDITSQGLPVVPLLLLLLHLVPLRIPQYPHVEYKSRERKGPARSGCTKNNFYVL